MKKTTYAGTDIPVDFKVAFDEARKSHEREQRKAKANGNGKAKENIPDHELPDVVLAHYNGLYGTVLHGASAVVVAVGEEGEYEFFKEADLIKTHRGELVAIQTKKGIEKKEAFSWWLHQLQRRKHGRVVFKPDNSLYTPGLPEAVHTKTLNLWRGLRIAPAPGDCELVTEHIYDVWASRDDARYNYIMDWLACKFQRIGQKVRTCLVFQGTQGDGKNVVWELVLAPILGNGARMITNCQHVTGRFNAALRGAVLLLLNEAFWGGGRDYEGILKSLTTDPTFMLEQKGIDPVEIPNFLDLIMFTNNEWPVRVDPGDRRYYITQTSPIHKGNTGYFRQLRERTTDATRAAFLDMLLSRDISDFDPEQFPDEPELKLHAKFCSLEVHERFIAELVLEMGLGYTVTDDSGVDIQVILAGQPGEDLAKTGEEWDKKGIDLSKAGLYQIYLNYLRSHSLGRATARNAFFRSLWRMLGPAGRSRQPWDSENKRLLSPIISLSTRSVCREAILNYLKTGSAYV